MNQYQAEKRLCWCYGVVATLLVVSVICIAIPYNHWRATLDVCPGNPIENTNCGCIFFAVSTFQYFTGSHNSYCLYAIFAPLPAIAYAIIMALFHMYRVCINNIGQYEDEKSVAMEEIEGETIVVRTRAHVTRRNDGVIYCWIPSACIAAIFALYTMIHSIIITNGFIKTCNQYRVQLVRELPASGDHAAAIHFRLDCNAIFNFMDYLLKDAPNSRRGEFINTAIALEIAIVLSWVSVIIWIAAIVISSIRAHKEKDVLTCCGN